jgi:hypothetical protein
MASAYAGRRGRWRSCFRSPTTPLLRERWGPDQPSDLAAAAAAESGSRPRTRGQPRYLPDFLARCFAGRPRRFDSALDSDVCWVRRRLVSHL